MKLLNIVVVGSDDHVHSSHSSGKQTDHSHKIVSCTLYVEDWNNAQHIPTANSRSDSNLIFTPQLVDKALTVNTVKSDPVNWSTRLSLGGHKVVTTLSRNCHDIVTAWLQPC